MIGMILEVVGGFKMIVLSNSYCGLTINCSECRALLGYNITDVYGNVIYCPICKKPTEVPLVKEN